MKTNSLLLSIILLIITMCAVTGCSTTPLSEEDIDECSGGYGYYDSGSLMCYVSGSTVYDPVELLENSDGRLTTLIRMNDSIVIYGNTNWLLPRHCCP